MEYESLALFRHYCMKKYLGQNEAEDLLECPVCHQWFHEKCFELWPLCDLTVIKTIARDKHKTVGRTSINYLFLVCF